jgi:hypothetical protein
MFLELLMILPNYIKLVQIKSEKEKLEQQIKKKNFQLLPPLQPLPKHTSLS